MVAFLDFLAVEVRKKRNSLGRLGCCCCTVYSTVVVLHTCSALQELQYCKVLQKDQVRIKTHWR